MVYGENFIRITKLDCNRGFKLEGTDYKSDGNLIKMIMGIKNEHIKDMSADQAKSKAKRKQRVLFYYVVEYEKG